MVTTSINLADLDGSNGFRLDGGLLDAKAGFSVSNAGDVNGDGFDDMIIGAPAGTLFNQDDSNFVVFGKASGFDATISLSGLDGSNGFRIDEGDGLGRRISNAGDVNGDGFDDVIVGGSSYPGSSYMIFGKDSGFNAVLNLSSLDGNNGFRIDGGENSEGINRWVSSAGDVNGDGFGDFIVGVPNASPNGDFSGSSYVVFGKASDFDATMSLSDLDGNNGFRLDGTSTYDFSGNSVSSAGDVNGDGFDDVIINAPGPANVNSPSAVYVVFGKGSGFNSSLNLSDLNGTNGFRLNNITGHNYSVSNAGDINGDGFDDFSIGGTGGNYVIFGKSSGFGTALDISALDGSDGFRLEGVVSRSALSISNAGDVNGDGADDLIIGDAAASPNGNYGSGSSYVVFGKTSGFNATLDLSNLDSGAGFRMDGVANGDNSGFSVSEAGDVNNDGFDDLLIGAPEADPNGPESGSSYVIFGRSDFTGDEVDFPGTLGDDIFTGTPAAESFVTGDGNDRMIGRGGADSFDGGAGNDYIRILGDDFQLVDGGSGTDTLGLAGSNFNLDLSSVIDKIHGIENIALYGNGDNTLTLIAQNVIDLSDTTNTLKIKGNTGDSVVGLSSGWTDGGVHGNFHTYTQGDAVLLIGVDVTTDFPMIV